MMGKTFVASAVWSWVAVAGVVMGIAGCQGHKEDVNSRFEALYTSEWKWRQEQFADDEDSRKPISNHLPKVDPAAQEARLKYWEDVLAKLDTIPREALSAEHQVNYDIYRDLLSTAIEGLAFHNDALPIRGVASFNLLMPVNQLDGVQQSVPRILGMMPRATLEDYQNLVSRLKGVGALVDQTIALMERGVAAGFTPPRLPLRDLPDQVSAQLVDDPLKSPMLEAFVSPPSAIPQADRERLKREAVEAIDFPHCVRHQHRGIEHGLGAPETGSPVAGVPALLQHADDGLRAGEVARAQ